MPKDSLAKTLLLETPITEKEAMQILTTPLSATPVYATPIYMELSDSERSVIKNKVLQAGLHAMHQDIDQAFEESVGEHKITSYVTGGVSVSLAAGAVSYMLRAGALMSSFLATIPIWKGFDPVAVLLTPKKKKEKDEKLREEKIKQAATKTEQKAENMFSKKESD